MLFRCRIDRLKVCLPGLSFTWLTQKQVSEICKICDGAVVGSSLVKIIEENLNNKSKIIKLVSEFVKKLKQGTKI